MTEAEEYKMVADAIEMGRDALKREAFDEHSKARPGIGELATRDMCACGETTGTGQTEKCKGVRMLSQLADQYRAESNKSLAEGR